MPQFDLSFDNNPGKIEDKYVQPLSKIIRKFIEKNKEDVFYYRELVVYFEDITFGKKRIKPYHWVTGHALHNLVEGGFLKISREKYKYGGVLFFMYKSFRYPRRRMKKKIDVINKYSDHSICKVYGEHADNSFLLAILKKHFKFLGEDIKKIGRKEWKKTEHNLDFAIEKDEVVYGVEVKNTLDYINKEELDIKIAICKYLGIRPLFILREAPPPYIHEIINAGGFALIFKKQIYPSYLAKLVEEICDVTLLKNDVMVSDSIPDGIIERFINWHNRQKN